MLCHAGAVGRVQGGKLHAEIKANQVLESSDQSFATRRNITG